MKKAIGYIRISTKDQSVYSLDGQRSEIETYCRRNDYHLLNIWEEDGQSAKNFDRLNWQQLESYIKQYHKDIDYLIVYKYDRFSRNLTEALAMIDKLEKKYKIIILSILENIGVHPKSPVFFMFRTQLLLNANNELNYIKERTAFGMYQGAKSGRFLHAAPFGYTNSKDSEKRPTIIPHPEKAEVVRQAFKLYMAGVAMEQIRRDLRPDGLPMEGNGAVRRLLSNPAYAGMVKVPSFYDEPEKLVDGKHEAIIDKTTWWAAQAKLSGKQYNKHDNEIVPLRGNLHCKCGRLLSAGNSKGKYKYYWYYICPACRDSLSAVKLHRQFDEMLGELTLQPHQLEFLQSQAVHFIKENLQAAEKELARKNRERRDLEEKIDSIEEKYIANTMDDTTYRKWKARYETERMNLLGEIDDLNTPVEETWQRYENNLGKLSDIAHIYNVGEMNDKKAFINVVFDNKLSHADGIYRTLYLSPIFRHKALILKEKRLLEVQQPFPNSEEFCLSAPPETIIKPFLKLLQWAAQIKAA